MGSCFEGLLGGVVQNQPPSTQPQPHQPPQTPNPTPTPQVGPRMALQPIRIFDGSFSGATLYENPAFVSPNTVRRMLKQRAAGKYNRKVAARGKRRAHEAENPHAPRAAFELNEVFRE